MSGISGKCVLTVRLRRLFLPIMRSMGPNHLQLPYPPRGLHYSSTLPATARPLELRRSSLCALHKLLNIRFTFSSYVNLGSAAFTVL
eukprot:911152-Amphidinium_carterae.2